MDGQNLISEIAFSQPVINIGSDGGNDVILSGNSVGEFHAMLNYDNGVWNLLPLDAGKQTLVNGHAIAPEGCVVQSGTILSIADYRLTLSLNGINADLHINKQTSAFAAPVETDEDTSERNIILTVTAAPAAEIEPGSSTECELTVTNAGPLVANMQLQVQGIPAAWVQIIPPVVNLNEGRRGVFTVRINPPRSSEARAGVYNLHFAVISPNYPRETGTADISMSLLPYSDFLVNGPSPRRLTLSRRQPEASTDIVVVNNSNAPTTYSIRAVDDSNEIYFAYKHGDNSITQGQDNVTVEPGDHVRVPLQVGAHKKPLFGFINHQHHYYTNVAPIERPMDAQSLLGEVTVRPLINSLWLLLFLLIAVFACVVIFQPYIYNFSDPSGKRTEVILSGSSAVLNWRISPFASSITLDDGSGAKNISRNGMEYVSPTSATTYTVKAENILSRLLGLSFEKTMQVLTIPKRPTVDVFKTDQNEVNFEQPVVLSWSVSEDAQTASIVANKQTTALAADKYSGDQKNAYTTDTLLSIRAANASGYEMKSLFINVRPDKINLKRYVAWVRPNGIAVPENNDVRRTTRWGSLQLTTDTAATQTIKPASVNPMPAPQTNTLEIPDNFMTAGSSASNMNPEQRALSGYTQNQNNSYQVVNGNSGSEGLLVSPSLNPTPTAPVAEVRPIMPLSPTAAPAASPESAESSRDFSVKLVEIVEDPLSPDGYRVINYFPDYVLQKGEQVLVEWAVEGVSQIKIENLSNEVLSPTGSEYIYPEKSVNLVLDGEVGSVKKAYSLPLRVAGDSDDGEGSGLNCELKANATTLAVPGTVMLTWTGGGNNRVQLLSSAKAESDTEDAEKQKEQEAKEKGETYTRPQNAAMSGGILADYLQPSGFMRVNLDKQTTFVLNAYDGNGNVICTKNVQVNLAGGNDKLDLKLRITKVADANNVSQPFYTIGQTVQVTAALTDFKKGTDPTGTILVTDGFSTCSMTWPVNHCSFTAKQAGTLKLTAVYSGDDTYKKKTATSSYTVIEKIETETIIDSAIKTDTNKANLITFLNYVNELKNQYGISPTGTITFTAGTGTCDLDIVTLKVACGGKAETKQDGKEFDITDFMLTDASAKTIRAKYNGDDYYKPSQSAIVEFNKIDTTLSVSNAYKSGDIRANFNSVLSWKTTDAGANKPTGTITFTIGSDSCKLTLDPSSKEQKNFTCSDASTSVELDTTTDGQYKLKLTNVLLSAGNTADRVKADYAGDSQFNDSTSEYALFPTIPTSLEISDQNKTTAGLVNLKTSLSWIDEPPVDGTTPHGTIKLTSGLAVCTLDIASDPVRFTDCTGVVTSSKDGKKLTYDIKNLKIGDGSGTSIKADYSGDGLYLASASPAMDFNKVNTEIVIESAYKSEDIRANFDSVLSWKTTDAGTNKPTGTITFSLGSDSCKLTLDPIGDDENIVPDEEGRKRKEQKNFTCSDSTTKVWLEQDTSGKYNLTLTNVLLSNGNTADRIKADYAGDALFNPSSSDYFLFDTVPTNLILANAEKNPTGTIDTDIELSWVDDPPETGMKPTGTIKLTSGTGTCTLDLATNKFKEQACDIPVPVPTEADKSLTYSITGLMIGDGTGADLRAEYSGGSVFESSVSDTVSFDKIDTELSITDAYKEGPMLADLKGLLKWDAEKADGAEPTGTITFTIGSDTCKLNISTLEFSCSGENTHSGKDTDTLGELEYTLTKIVLSSDSADRVTAAYSGDALFNPSSSKIIMFKTIQTTMEIADLKLNEEGTAFDTELKLSYADLAKTSAGIIPNGVINLKAGEVSCEVNLATAKAKCGDTNLTDAVITRGTSESGTVTDTIKLTGVPHESPEVTSITAVYNGDNTYDKSNEASWTLERMATSLSVVIEPAYDKNGYAVATSIEMDDKVDDLYPGGTFTYTFKPSGTTCTLTLRRKMSDPFPTTCGTTVNWSSSTTSGSYTLNHYNLDPSDTSVTVTYSGDSRFLPSGPAEGKVPTRKIRLYEPESDLKYVNIVTSTNASAYYPRHPEEHNYFPAERCSQANTTCMVLPQGKRTLTVYVDMQDKVNLPDDAVLTFSGSGIPDTTCNPVLYSQTDNTIYSCSIEATFTDMGFYNSIVVSYWDPNDVFTADPITLDPVYAIAATTLPSWETRAIINYVKNSAGEEIANGGTICLNDTVTVSLDIYNYFDQVMGAKVFNSPYVIYGYNYITYERINIAQYIYNSSLDNIVSLKIDDPNITHIVVEYLGRASGGLNPTLAVKLIRVSTACSPSSTSSTSSTSASASSGSPVSLSLEFEPATTEP